MFSDTLKTKKKIESSQLIPGATRSGDRWTDWNVIIQKAALSRTQLRRNFIALMQGKITSTRDFLLLVQPTGICAAKQTTSKTKMFEPPSDKFGMYTKKQTKLG